MTIERQRSSLASVGSGCALLLVMVGSSAWAQDPSQQDEPLQGLDTIVVTGERVERSLRDTAASVAVLDGEDVKDASGDHTIKEVVGWLPNVYQATSVGTPTIRGQSTQGPNNGAGAFFGGTTPRATINVDGRYLSYNEYFFGTTSIWDLDSIEVFRGPQTTSQGANSIAGAIIVNTKDPTFTPEFEGQLVGASEGRRRASVALSGPLVEGELAGATGAGLLRARQLRGPHQPGLRSRPRRP